MGSCENITAFEEPLGSSVIEKHSCDGITEKLLLEQGSYLGTGIDVVGANVNSNDTLGGCSSLSNDKSTHCVSANGATDRSIDDTDRQVGEGENTVGVYFEKVLDDDCAVSELCDKNYSEVGVGNLPRTLLDSSCVTFASGQENGGCSGDGFAHELGNVASPLLEKCVDDKCQSLADVCLGGTDGLILEKASFEDYDRSVKSTEMPLEKMRENISLENHIQQDEQKDDRKVNGPFVDGVAEVLEEENDVLAEVNMATGNQTDTSKVGEMLNESNPVTGLLINDEKDDKNVVCNLVQEGDLLEDRSEGSAGIEKNNCSQMLPGILEKPSGLTAVNGSQSDGVEKDSSNSVQQFVEVKEANYGDSVKMEKEGSNQMLPSQGREETSELKQFSTAPSDYVSQDDQRNGEIIDYVSSEGVTGVMEENSAAFGCILPLPGDTVPMGPAPEHFSPTNCIRQNECKDQECINCTSFEEVRVGKSYVVAGAETNFGDQVSSLKNSQIPSELTPMTGGIEGLTDTCYLESPSQQSVLLESASGVSNNSADCNEGNCNSQSICDTVKEEKSDASVDIGVNMCNWNSAAYNDDLMTSLDRRNNQNDDKFFSGLSGETLVKQIEDNKTDNVITMPVKSFTTSLEGLHMADALSEATQKDEERKDTTVEVLSEENVTEVVEDKRDATANLTFEICTDVFPDEEKSTVSLLLCRPTSLGENGISDSLNATKLLRKDTSTSTAVDHSGKAGHDKEDNGGVGCLIKTNDPDIVSSSSRRSSRTGKSRQKTTKRAAKKSRSKAKVQSAHGIDEIILKMARKKRSCSSKQARSSIWGLLDNLTRYGSKSDVCTSSQALDQGPSQVKSGKGSRKRNKTQTGQSSLNTSTRCLRFKVKVGKEICRSIGFAPIPEVVDTAKSDYADVGGKRTELGHGNLEFPNPAHSVEVKLEEEGTEKKIHCFDKKPEDVTVCTENSALDGHHLNKEYEGILIPEKSAGDAAFDDYSNIHPNKGFESLKGVIGNDYVDPGTSPDSEVINAVPDILVGERSQDDLRNIDLTSETLTSPGCITGSNRGKKRGTIAKPANKRGGKHVVDNGSRSCETLTASLDANTSNNSPSSSEEPLPLSKETEVFEKVAVVSTEANRSKSNGKRKEKSKARSRRRKTTCAQGGNLQKSANKRNIKKKGGMVFKRGQEGIRDQVEEEKECELELGIQVADSNGKCDARENIASSGVANMDTVSTDVSQQYIPPESAWVLCDDCSKWRRIPVALANSIDENCRWVCKDNVDKTFADCSIPQEKSNADINTELGISDCEEDASDGHSKYSELGKGFDKSLVALPESSFRRIDSNMFLHRSRKSQTIDEIMVCHCNRPKDSGRLGCGDECLNRMLNIECVQGTCPCGELCSNQQFQKRNYANMQWFPCGKKGFGLQLLEDVPKGQFIIEYVGEVLDMQAYEARQTEYAAKGHKHFYFMTLNGSEVIDACAKGNLGRFINHSCDPNCRTEKWMVNGEICIGLFAMRDMKKGEELTFDYNYVRVFGAAAKKCHCGSPQCRGYIGGDPQNTDIIYQGDSDEEYPEPVMIDEGETANPSKKINPRSSSSASRKIAESIKERNELRNPTTAVRQPEIEDSVNQSASAITQSHGSEEIEDSKMKCISVQPGDTYQQAEDVSGTPMSIVQQETSLEEETLIKTSSLTQQAETASPTVISSVLSVDGSDANNKSGDTVEDKQDLPKSRPRIKTSRSSVSVKKGKSNSSAPTGNKDRTVDIKVPLPSIKPKKPMEGSSNGRFEAVQEKLNELLDADGGISKRKDAPRGYLKLLLLTAVSGTGANKEAIQSNRDLSMILDGLLKTRSRVVLTDIINKNGLQMLHNILKQYRSDFKKIPILRKLLKILEYLAVREILTIQHISGGPPCPGMESLRESMLSLTEHDDKQVHQIARNFRDRWIPKHLRKPGYMDTDDGRIDFHRGVSNRLIASQNHRREHSSRPSEAIDCVTQSPVASTSVDNSASEASPSPCTGGGSQSSGPTRVRKRKSRWDQPAPIKRKEQKTESSCAEDGGQITEEDAPPGFSAPCNPPLVPSDALSASTSLSQQNTPHLKIRDDAVVGHPQKRFISRLPVSYGVPLAVLQQFGSPKAENVDGWVIAPGMPFHPFPPLPLFPRDKKSTPASEECHQGENNPSTTGANQSIAEIPGGDIHQQASKRIKLGSSNDLGKRFFRQQKWNRGPPWLWRRNDHRNSCGSPDSNCRVDDPCCNTFYQHPQQQNNH